MPLLLDTVEHVLRSLVEHVSVRADSRRESVDVLRMSERVDSAALPWPCWPSPWCNLWRSAAS